MVHPNEAKVLQLFGKYAGTCHDPGLRWARDDLRSLNAQIESVLREALRRSGRLKAEQNDQPNGDSME